MKKIFLLLTMLVLHTMLVNAQERMVSGKVADTKGSPVPNATIAIKGTGRATAADANGSFSIQAKQGDVLVVSGVGFETKEVAVGAQGGVAVELSASSTDLGAVVVTGYGSQIKKKYAGSATTVTVDEVRTQPIASFDQLLQGQGAGISVLANSGQPGAAASVRIRGTGSISGSAVPLYIVDGIQISAGDFATLNAGDFESVNILKDATATSMYGSRGSNGVVVITTRKGRAGQMRLNYDVQQGWSYFPENKQRLMNSAEKVDYEIERGNPYNWTLREQDSLKQINTNWTDVLFRTGRTSQHMLSASGGSERSTFFASLSYFNQEGIVRNTGLKRYTGRINLDNNYKNVRFGVNLQLGYSQASNTNENDEFIGSPLNAIRWTNPYERPYNPNTGNFQSIRSGQPNALQELLLNRRELPQVKALGNVFVEYAFPWVDGLSARTNWGGDFFQDEFTVYQDRRTYSGSLDQGGNGSLLRRTDRNFRYTGTTSLNYKKIIGDHDINAGVYHETVQYSFRNMSFTGYGLVNDFENEAGITAGTGDNNYIPTVGGTGTRNALLSYFADINYGYKGKYYITLVGRRDGSSRFGVNNRFAKFGSVGLSWSVTDENFFDKLRGTFDDLRFRVSYGSVGNQGGIGDFASRATFGRTTYAGVSGLAIADPGNPDLRWETSTTFNAAVDFSMLRKRLSGTVEFYNRLTTDLLFRRQNSGTTGFSTLLGNDGEMRNRGVELSLRADVIRNKSFRWSVDGNVTYNKNTILRLPEGQDQILSPTAGFLKVGSPLNSLYVVKYAGVDPANGAALYYKKDGKTVTSVYDPEDRVVLGTSDAPWFGGVGTSVGYKGFDLSAQLNFFLGREVYNYDRVNIENPDYLGDNLSADLIREWRNPGDVTDIPSPNNPFFGNTTRFVENGSFLRLRNVMLSYSLAKNVTDRLKIRTVRLFVQGQNLWTSTLFRSFDPEVAGSQLIGAQYPAMRQLTAGLNVGF